MQKYKEEQYKSLMEKMRKEKNRDTLKINSIHFPWELQNRAGVATQLHAKYKDFHLEEFNNETISAFTKSGKPEGYFHIWGTVHADGFVIKRDGDNCTLFFHSNGSSASLNNIALVVQICQKFFKKVDVQYNLFDLQKDDKSCLTYAFVNTLASYKNNNNFDILSNDDREKGIKALQVLKASLENEQEKSYCDFTIKKLQNEKNHFFCLIQDS